MSGLDVLKSSVTPTKTPGAMRICLPGLKRNFLLCRKDDQRSGLQNPPAWNPRIERPRHAIARANWLAIVFQTGSSQIS